MAPITMDSVDGKCSAERYQSSDSDLDTDHLKDVIQDLFEIQSAVYSYIEPETQEVLVNTM